jgi:hypothetical protein
VIVGAALVATAIVFTFFRPQFHPKGEGSLLKVDMSRYPSPSEGWTWPGGQPGFRFGVHEEEWNLSGVQGAELAPARAAARRWGVAPESVRLIDAIRLGPHDLNMIVAGTNAADHTCIGFVTPDAPAEYFCPNRLRSVSALLFLVKGTPSRFEGQTLVPAFLMGIDRAEVKRLTVDQPFGWNQVGLHAMYWGSWELSFALDASNDAVVTAYLRDGRVRRAPVNLALPGDRVIAIPG